MQDPPGCCEHDESTACRRSSQPHELGSPFTVLVRDTVLTVVVVFSYQDRNNHYRQGTLQDTIDWGAIGVKEDTKTLGKRTSVPSQAVLVFSNFNYYYHRATQKEIDHAPPYEDNGNAA